jgi:hypothetical protein
MIQKSWTITKGPFFNYKLNPLKWQPNFKTKENILKNDYHDFFSKHTDLDTLWSHKLGAT